MRGTELLVRVRDAGFRPVVRMTKMGADNIECCMNDPQMGRIVRAEEDHDGILKVWVDLNEFDEWNDQHADRNWYNDRSEPVLTAKEANQWPKDGIELIYLMLDHEVSEFFDFIDEGTTKVLALNITRVTVVEREHGTDLVTVHTDLPPGCPGLDTTPAILNMDVVRDGGAEYVRENFGVEPEVINTRLSAEMREAMRFAREDG